MVCHGAGQVEKSRSIGTSNARPFLINQEGSIQLPDRRLWISAIRGYFPTVSSRGTEVISSDDFRRIVACRLDGTGMREVFANSTGSAWSPSLSKDGRWIVCSVGPTFAGPGARTDIWKFRSDGSQAVNLTRGSKGNNAFPEFSSDGRRIVFRSGRDGNHEIYLMNADGTAVRRLTENGATDTMPAFSPNGDEVAFTSDRDGDYEIYTLKIGPDGAPGALRRVTNSPGRDMHPKYSPDGRWLVFASERAGINDEEPLIPVYNPQPYGEIWAVRLEDGFTVRLTNNKWEDGTPTWAILNRMD
jgi:Tol biopolymer transport system component